MKVNLRESPLNPEVKIVDIEGRIDAYTHNILEEEIRTLLNIGRTKIACDLSRVEYVGPAGLRMFLAAMEHARQNGGDIKISSLHPYVQRKFEFAGFHDICYFYPAVEQAVKAFGETDALEAAAKMDGIDVAAPTVQVPISKIMEKGLETERLDRDVLMHVEAEQKREADVPDKKNKTDTEKIEAGALLLARAKDTTEVFSLEEDEDTPREDEKSPEPTEEEKTKRRRCETQELPSQILKTISQKIDNLEKELPAEDADKKDRRFSFPMTYVIHHKIKEGFLGKLYYGKEVSSHGFSRPVVLKYIKNQYSHNRSIMKLLTQEMQQVALIVHQNIAQMYELVALENYSFLVMEYVDGISVNAILQQLRKRNRLFPPDIASLVVYTVSSALHYANRKTDDQGKPLETAHGEINPENVMVNRDRDVKLLGLGLSRVNLMLQFQQSPATIRNLEYLAPEVVTNGVPTVSGDIFALGVLFYEMLTGAKPYSEDQIRHQNFSLPAPPSHFNKKVSDLVDGIVLRCLVPETYRRFQTFQDIALQLEANLADKGFLLTQVALGKFLENNKVF